MPTLDVLTLGNAIVDVIAHTDDGFLVAEKLHKGSMNLIDEARAEDLYARMGQAVIVSGGSGANTAVGAASLGARAGFIGKVREDELGRVYRHDMNATGVRFDTAYAAPDGPATARSFILVTPDGERTMNTYLGACHNLTPDDIDAETVAGAQITYLEGYLWDPPAAKEAFRKAVDIAHGAGRKVALTLSDSFCVDRYRTEFLDLARTGALDILFANVHELKALYETADEDTAVAALRQEGHPDRDFLAVVTRSERGSLVVTRASTRVVDAYHVERIVDLTGAGDLFAGGFLAGMVRGVDHVACARLGAMAAAEVIGHIGARPQRNLLDMARENGLLD